MREGGGIETRGFVYSAAFHVGVVATLYAAIHLSLFERELPEETPIVVQLVNLAPETRATQLNPTPQKTEKPAEKPVEAPKPPEPKPEPPKAEPKPQPPPPPPPPQEAKLEPPPPPPQVAKAEPPPPPPEPKPEQAKAEPPPPKSEPLPEPPQRKPAPPKKKTEDVMSDAMLANLAKNSPTRQQEQAQKKDAAVEPQANSQPNARLGAQLTTNEMDTVVQQLQPCWNPDVGAANAAELTPRFHVVMNRDGTVQSATQLDTERNSDPFFKAAAERALDALHDNRCMPLKLPPEKYQQWKSFNLTFRNLQ
jgi:hypothetical protein